VPARAWVQTRAWMPVTVGLTAEETPAIVWMPATSRTRARSWTPVTVGTTTNNKHPQKHGCQQQHGHGQNIVLKLKS